MAILPLTLNIKFLNDSAEMLREAHAPGEVALLLGDAELSGAICLLRADCDIYELTMWLLKNKNAILKERIPLFLPKAVCVAQAISGFYDAVEDDGNELDTIFDYRSRHGLRFATRGVEISDIYIGLNSEDVHEISCFDDGLNWHYCVDLYGFFVQVESVYLKILQN